MRNPAVAVAIFGFSALLYSLTAAASVTLLDQDEWKAIFSGFVETDLIGDTARSFTEVAGNGPVDYPGTLAGDNGRTQFSIRNSRVAFALFPPRQGDYQFKGYMEFDLLGYDPRTSSSLPTNSESSFYTNPTLRVRHAFLHAASDGFEILLGQTWTLFGWEPYYILSTVSVAPVVGTIYERTPQLAFSKSLKMGSSNRLQGALSVTRPVQADSQIPGLDAGLRWTLDDRRAGLVGPSGDLKADPMSFAVSETLRAFETPLVGGGMAQTTHYLGSALAVDGMLPILAGNDESDYANTLALSGEFTAGQGYADEFPAWTGNLPQLPTTSGAGLPTSADLDAGQGAVDASGLNFQLVHLRTWNLQTQYHFPSGWQSFATLGYGQLYSDNVAGLAPVSGKVTYDRAEVAFINFFHDFSKQVRAAIEMDHFDTHYTDGTLAQDNRLQVSGWYRF